MTYAELAEQCAIYAVRIMDLETKLDSLEAAVVPNVAPEFVCVRKEDWNAIFKLKGESR